MNECRVGDCRDVMRALAREGVRVQTCVTSPPYFGLRDYGHIGQLGLEPTPIEYISNMVDAFRCVRDILCDDGTLWLNIGDSYAGSWGAQSRGNTTGEGKSTIQGSSPLSARQIGAHPTDRIEVGSLKNTPGCKEKDLIGIPWMLAFALRADGWYLRQEIIWHKPNPMPESVRDRCTKAHESLFLLTKSPRYYYDADAISEGLSQSSVARLSQDGWASQSGSDRRTGGGATNSRMKAAGGARSKRNSFARSTKETDADHGQKPQHRPDRDDIDYVGRRNKRSVWTISTHSYSGAHFAVMPESLAEPCILAGSRPGDLVLDPFMGSGTTAAVAQRLGRRWVGSELNPKYLALQAERTRQAGFHLEHA